MEIRTTYLVLGVIQYLLPYFFFLLVAFRERLHYSNRINIPIVCLYSIFLIWSTLVIFTKKGLNGLRYSTIIFMGVAILLCLLFLKGRSIINVFILFIISSYLDVIDCFIEAIGLSFFSHNHSMHEMHVIQKTFLIVITMPLLYLFLRKLIRPMIDSTQEFAFWRYLWFIPMCFYWCFHLGISPIYANHAGLKNPTASLIPFAWILIIFLVYYLILRMLFEIIQASRLREELQMADIQNAIQKKQFERLQEDIEQSRAFRHDMRHILLALNGYAQKEDGPGIKAYIRRTLEKTKQSADLPFCKNQIINDTISYYFELAAKQGITITSSIAISEHLRWSTRDICIILSNLFETAMAVSMISGVETPIFHLALIEENQHLTIQGGIGCLFGFHAEKKRTAFFTHAEGKMKLDTIRAVTADYDGSVKFGREDGKFTIRIQL